MEKSHWCLPALPLPPTVNRQPRVLQVPTGSIQNAVYGDDFYGPGLSAIYLSPWILSLHTHSFSSVFHKLSPSVFHYFSSTSRFPNLKLPLAILQSGKRPDMTHTLWNCHLALRFQEVRVTGGTNKPTSWADAWPEAQKLFCTAQKCHQKLWQTHTWMHVVQTMKKPFRKNCAG